VKKKVKPNLAARKAEAATMEMSMAKKCNKKNRQLIIKKAKRRIKVKMKKAQALPIMKILHTY